jgi:hypothetical protein
MQFGNFTSAPGWCATKPVPTGFIKLVLSKYAPKPKAPLCFF